MDTLTFVFRKLATHFIQRRVRSRQPLIYSAVVAASLLASCPALALTLTIFDPDRVASPSSTETFVGTVRNDSGVTLDAMSDMFLNFNGFDPTVVSLTQLLGTPDFSLPDGETSPPVALFSLALGPGAVGTYFADVTLEDSLSDLSNTVTVRVRVPEPGTVLLLGTGLVVFAFRSATLRRRRHS